VGNAKTTKSTRGMFIGKYISIFVDGGYQTDLEKRWEVWQNTKKGCGTSYCQLTILIKAKRIIMYMKTSKNDYINGLHVKYILL